MKRETLTVDATPEWIRHVEAGDVVAILRTGEFLRVVATPVKRNDDGTIDLVVERADAEVGE